MLACANLSDGSCMPPSLAALLLLLLLLLAPPALAAPTAGLTRRVDPAPRSAISLKGGASIFFQSQSHSAQHQLKPVVRLEVSFRAFARIHLGVELAGVVTANENYRLIGGILTAQASLVERGLYSLRLRWGFGAGTGPRILSADLATRETLAPWVQVGLGQRFRVHRSVALGLDVTSDNLSVLSPTLTLDYRF